MTFMGPFNYKQKQSHEFWWSQLLPCGNSEAVHGRPGHNGPPPSRIGLMTAHKQFMQITSFMHLLCDITSEGQENDF